MDKKMSLKCLLCLSWYPVCCGHREPGLQAANCQVCLHSALSYWHILCWASATVRAPSPHVCVFREVGSGGVWRGDVHGMEQRKQRQQHPRWLQIRTIRDGSAHHSIAPQARSLCCIRWLCKFWGNQVCGKEAIYIMQNLFFPSLRFLKNEWCLPWKVENSQNFWRKSTMRFNHLKSVFF